MDQAKLFASFDTTVFDSLDMVAERWSSQFEDAIKLTADKLKTVPQEKKKFEYDTLQILTNKDLAAVNKAVLDIMDIIETKEPMNEPSKIRAEMVEKYTSIFTIVKKGREEMQKFRTLFDQLDSVK